MGCAGRFALAWEGKEGFPVDKILSRNQKDGRRYRRREGGEGRSKQTGP